MFVQLCLLLLLGSAVLYFFVLKHRKYWRRRGIAGPKPRLISGNFDSLFGTRPWVFKLSEWTERYGKVYGIQYGWRNMMVLSDPALIQELLVTKFEYFHSHNINPLFGDIDTDKWVHLFAAKGPRWKRLRAIANPAFSVSNLKKIMLIMDDSIKIAVDLLDKAWQQGKPIDMHRHFVEMTFDVIARVALGQRESSQFCSDKADLAIRSFQRANTTPFDYLSWLFPWLGHYIIHPYVMWTGLLRGDPIGVLKAKLIKELKERKALKEAEEQHDQQDQKQRYNKGFVDFIDLFLDIESEQQIVQKQQNGGLFNKTACGVEKKNTREEIVMQLLLFLLAGFDTTANSLSVICFNLANHPNVQEKVLEEIDSVCNDEDPSYEQLSQLKYTEAVIKETLRLCPIASSVVNRVCAKTTTLGEHTVEEGTIVQVDSFSLHRNTEVWGEDAQQFRPERWLEESAQKSPPIYAFGGGPRICLGMRLAMMEEKMALTRILRKFRIGRCAQTEKELNFSGQIVINPETVTVALELRESEDK